MKRSTIIQIIIHTLILGLILFVGFLPVLSVAIAGGIASANGCQLDEGSVHPCVVNGVDMGETLYSMGVMGWFMLVTLPLGLGAAVVYAVAIALFYLVRGMLRRRKAAGHSAP
jgi:hypothetical protein